MVLSQCFTNIYIQQCGWCLFGDRQPNNDIIKKTTSPLSNFCPWSPTTSWEIIFHQCMLTPSLYTKNYKVSIWRPFSWWMFLNPHNKIVIKTTIQNYNQSYYEYKYINPNKSTGTFDRVVGEASGTIIHKSRYFQVKTNY